MDRVGDHTTQCNLVCAEWFREVGKNPQAPAIRVSAMRRVLIFASEIYNVFLYRAQYVRRTSVRHIEKASATYAGTNVRFLLLWQPMCSVCLLILTWCVAGHTAT